MKAKWSTKKIRNSFFAKKNSVKGGGTPLTDKIRKLVFDIAPYGADGACISKVVSSLWLAEIRAQWKKLLSGNCKTTTKTR